MSELIKEGDCFYWGDVFIMFDKNGMLELTEDSKYYGNGEILNKVGDVIDSLLWMEFDYLGNMTEDE